MTVRYEPKRWMVLDVGCAHCGEATHIVGIFTNKETANDICRYCEDHYFECSKSGGMHYYHVRQLPALINGINKEWADYHKIEPTEMIAEIAIRITNQLLEET